MNTRSERARQRTSLPAGYRLQGSGGERIAHSLLLQLLTRPVRLLQLDRQLAQLRLLLLPLALRLCARCGDGCGRNTPASEYRVPAGWDGVSPSTGHTGPPNAHRVIYRIQDVCDVTGVS